MPYKGSKNKIAEKIISELPSAENFYDLFAGGCAISHCALLSGKYKNIIINDIDGGIIQLFSDAINGKYEKENRWISREEFLRLKENDAYIRYCWSFANNGKNYIYAREIEYWKKAIHYARVFGDYSLLKQFGIENSDGSCADINLHKEDYQKKYIQWYIANIYKSEIGYEKELRLLRAEIEHSQEELRQYLLASLKSSGLTQSEVGRKLGTQMQGHYFGKSQWMFPTKEHYQKMQSFMPKLEKNYDEICAIQKLIKKFREISSLPNISNYASLQSLQNLSRLQRLQGLKSLQGLATFESHCGDYKSVEIKPNSIIYCDIPYKGTDGYLVDFDHERFYEWALRQKNIFISEYSMPSDFVQIAEFETRSTLNVKSKNSKVSDKLWIPKENA